MEDPLLFPASPSLLNGITKSSILSRDLASPLRIPMEESRIPVGNRQLHRSDNNSSPTLESSLTRHTRQGKKKITSAAGTFPGASKSEETKPSTYSVHDFHQDPWYLTIDFPEWAPPFVGSASPTMNPVRTPPPSSGQRCSSSSWSKDKDELLIRARRAGLNWQLIAAKSFPDKTPNACRKRHERLTEKRDNCDTWEDVKLDSLAKAYNEVREQMWRLLAEKMGGVKWHVVESKVS